MAVILVHFICKAKVLVQSCLTLFDPVDCRPQAPLSMGFPRQEDWSGLSFLPPGDLPDSGIKTMFLAFPALAGRFFFSFFLFYFFTTAPPGKPLKQTDKHTNKDSVVLKAACGHPGPRVASLQVRPLEGELWSWH